jgi:hypothetical protein
MRTLKLMLRATQAVLQVTLEIHININKKLI